MGWYTDAKKFTERQAARAKDAIGENSDKAGTLIGGGIGFAVGGPPGAAAGAYLGEVAGRKINRDSRPSTAPDQAKLPSYLKNVRATVVKIVSAGVKMKAGQEIVPGVVFVEETESDYILRDISKKPPTPIRMPKIKGSVSEQEAKSTIKKSLRNAAITGVVAVIIKKALGG